MSTVRSLYAAISSSRHIIFNLISSFFGADGGVASSAPAECYQSGLLQLLLCEDFLTQEKIACSSSAVTLLWTGFGISLVFRVIMSVSAAIAQWRRSPPADDVWESEGLGPGSSSSLWAWPRPGSTDEWRVPKRSGQSSKDIHCCKPGKLPGR